jgi:hypothetical protein
MTLQTEQVAIHPAVLPCQAACSTLSPVPFGASGLRSFRSVKPEPCTALSLWRILQ